MRSDVRDTVGHDVAEIRLEVGRHKKLFAAIGARSAAQIAELTGVSERTVWRARTGTFGEAFMAQTVAALRDHASVLRANGLEPPTLDDLFKVVTRRRAA